MAQYLDLQPGEKYGRLTIIQKDGIHKKPCGHTQSKYLCKCDCGNVVSVLRQNILNGNTKSCGCLSKEMKSSKKLPDNRGIINFIILQYKRHAKDRNLEWNLSFDEVKQLISSPCFYCGTIESNCVTIKSYKEGYRYNGIDRVDSSKGYFSDNVVPCCKICNKAKLDLSQKDFIIWVNKVAEYTKSIFQQFKDKENEKFTDDGVNNT